VSVWLSANLSLALPGVGHLEQRMGRALSRHRAERGERRRDYVRGLPRSRSPDPIPSRAFPRQRTRSRRHRARRRGRKQCSITGKSVPFMQLEVTRSLPPCSPGRRRGRRAPGQGTVHHAERSLPSCGADVIPGLAPIDAAIAAEISRALTPPATPRRGRPSKITAGVCPRTSRTPVNEMTVGPDTEASANRDVRRRGR
jgi:hypothetical protein